MVLQNNAYTHQGEYDCDDFILVSHNSLAIAHIKELDAGQQRSVRMCVVEYEYLAFQ